MGKYQCKHIHLSFLTVHANFHQTSFVLQVEVFVAFVFQGVLGLSNVPCYSWWAVLFWNL